MVKQPSSSLNVNPFSISLGSWEPSFSVCVRSSFTTQAHLSHHFSWESSSFTPVGFCNPQSSGFGLAVLGSVQWIWWTRRCEEYCFIASRVTRNFPLCGRACQMSLQSSECNSIFLCMDPEYLLNFRFFCLFERELPSASSLP